MEIPQDEIDQIIYNVEQLIDIANNNEDSEMLTLCYKTKNKLEKYSVKAQEIERRNNEFFTKAKEVFQ